MKPIRYLAIAVLSASAILLNACDLIAPTSSSVPTEDSSPTSLPSSSDTSKDTNSSSSSSSQSSPQTSSASEGSGSGKTLRVFAQINSLDSLDLSKKTLLLAPNSDDGNALYVMTPNAKSDSLPWYIIGMKGTFEEDGRLRENDAYAEWDIAKNGDVYNISCGGKYLQSYVDGTHYSINIGNNASYSNAWSIAFDAAGIASLKSDRGVYLEYYNSSFCGYKNTAPVYLYQENGTIEVEDKPIEGGDFDPGDLVDSRWSGLDFSTYGETFRNTLAGKISGSTTSYSNCLNVGAKAAAYPNANSSTFIPFYHEAKDSEKTTTSGCNREHTWPDSRGGGSIETDPIVIRPTITKDNSNRGNNFYGNTVSNEWDPASCGYEGARGESARIILYAATRYYSKGLVLSNNPSDSTSAKSMGTLKTLLEWNLKYRPTEFEKTVNDRYEKMGYARNPFVDHPEYANFIWDEDGLRKSQLVVHVDTSETSSEAFSSSITSASSVDNSSIESTSEEILGLETIDITKFPKSYDQEETSYTISDIDFSVTYCLYDSGKQLLQLKKSANGYFYNTSALSGFSSLVIEVDTSKDPYYSLPVVTYGDAANPETTATSTHEGNTYTFDLNSAPFFKVSSGDSYACYLKSVSLL